MKSSDKLLELIKESEGFSSTPYLCPAKIPTIGYGSTRYPDSRKVSLSDNHITKEEATTYLRFDVVDAEKLVTKSVTVPLTQGQFDALVDFVYNLGSGAFLGSTLLKVLNNGDYSTASNEFLKWNKARVDGILKELPGLTKRRKAEQVLFNGG